MAFVYKQKHVEDALPAFRVSRLSNPGLYSAAAFRVLRVNNVSVVV